MSKTSYEQFGEDMDGCLELGCTPRIILFGLVFGVIMNFVWGYILQGHWCFTLVVESWCL